MHYKNGREAKQGDHVIAKSYMGNLVSGVIYDLNPNGGTCNVNVSVLIPGGVYQLTCQNVATMVHVEDAFSAMEALSANVAKVVTEFTDKVEADASKLTS